MLTTFTAFSIGCVLLLQILRGEHCLPLKRHMLMQVANRDPLMCSTYAGRASDIWALGCILFELCSL